MSINSTDKFLKRIESYIFDVQYYNFVCFAVFVIIVQYYLTVKKWECNIKTYRNFCNTNLNTLMP